MKKRIISMFLIVSIIASLFVVSAISNSVGAKVVCYIVPPKNVKVTTVGNNFRVTWTHNADDATLFYHIWVRNKSKSSSWKSYASYKNKIGTFTQDIGPMTKLGKSGDTFEIKVSCHDEMGKKDWYSDNNVPATRTFVGKPTLSGKWLSNTQAQYYFTPGTGNKQPHHYVFWLAYKSNSGNKWSAWQQRYCQGTTTSVTYKKGFTYRIKVSAVINGYHSDFSNNPPIQIKK